MSFRFEQKPGSIVKSANPPSAELTWFAAGSSDANFVEAFAYAGTPAVISTIQGLLFRQDIKLKEDGFQLFTVTVPYAPNNLDGSNQAVGSYRVSFDTTGGTVHIRASKESVARFPNSKPANKQLINWHDDGQVEGTEIVIPALKITVSFRHPAGIVTMAQVRNLARRTAYVNSDTFLGFQAGEVLFLGATGSWGNDVESEVQYHFACSENAEGLTIGGIAGVAKKGHEFAWIKWKSALSDNLQSQEPDIVYIERVYDTTSLSTLLGFGGS